MSKILVVVDMQNDFISGCLGNAECLASVDKVTEVIKKNEYDYYILTRDTHFENYLDTQEGKKLPVVHCLKDSEGWQINDDVMKAVLSTNKEYIFIDKPSFGSIELSSILKNYNEKNEVSEVDFVGVCTGICVISNVIITKATLPEVPVKVISSACACVTPDTHNTAIAAMQTCQVDII